MQKFKPYIISALVIFIIIILFPPVNEYKMNDGYSFIISLGQNHSIDGTRIFFELLLATFAISLIYLLRDKFLTVKEYLQRITEQIKKIKIYLILICCTALGIILWLNISEKIADMFFYSENDFQSYLNNLNSIQKDYLQWSSENSEDKYDGFHELMVSVDNKNTVLLSSLVLPYHKAKQIIEKHLVDRKYGTWEKLGNVSVDVGGLSYGLTKDKNNIEYDIPEGKTVTKESFNKIIEEVNKTKLRLYNARIVDTNIIRAEYNDKRFESEKFSGRTVMTKVIGVISLLMLFGFLTFTVHNKK